jgi:hypothetical protein
MVYRWEGGNQIMEWEDLTLRDDLIVGDDLTVGWNATITGSLIVNWGEVTTGWVILAAWDNLVGSSTSDIIINTNKFNVAWATGNTEVGGTFTSTGLVTATAGILSNDDITLGAGDDLVGSSTSKILMNTDKFTVDGATGNVVIGGTQTNTVGDLTLTDGDLVLTANASKVSFTGTGANGWVLKNLKNAATSDLSGTALDVEIDIGWTPYHFHVYPTKA